MFDPSHATPTLTDLVRTMADADAAQARAVRLLAALGASAIARDAAMPAEIALGLGSRWTARDVRDLFVVAETLAHMPLTRALLTQGVLSYAQARTIALELKGLSLQSRRDLDHQIASTAEHLERAEPDALIDRVRHAVLALRPDLELRREDRRVESNYLVLSPYLDGSGGTIAGQLDAISLATVATAVEAEADQPHATEDEHTPSRGRQFAEAMVRLCERSLGSEHGRPRARVLVSIDARDLSDLARDGADLLWDLVGGAGRLSPVSAAAELCDADLQAVIFRRGSPIAVGDARSTVPPKIRAAVTARDRGCRFPGCRAPVAWSQIHHIRAKGGHDPANLVMLCTRCHRRVHRRAWRIEHHPDGVIAFANRGRTWHSAARAGPVLV